MALRPATIVIDLLLAFCAASAARAQAQDRESPPATPEPWLTLDVIGLWHKYRPKALPARAAAESRPAHPGNHFIVLAPAIGSTPSTGLTRWFLQGDNRLNWTSLNTYELGANATTLDAANVKFDQSAYLAYSREHGFAPPIGAGARLARAASISASRKRSSRRAC